ncbi:MAG: creatininase family protein [Alphaproteobacteria bacterium]|nr:creatininase family protein [Alphaproteobacteria bacterium]
MTATHYWQDLTTADFAALDLARQIAVLPLGAIEQHGPHLPLSTDRKIADGVINRTLELAPERLPVLILPTLPVGLSIEHGGYPGTLSGSAETLLRLWVEIGEAVARTGVRKMVLFNSHGGQSNLTALVAQELRSAHGLFVVSHHCYRIWRESPHFDESERREGIHGGAIETSIMLALDPEHVDMAAARRFESTLATMGDDHSALVADGKAAFAWEIQDVNPAGAVGDAADADAKRGHALIEDAARQFLAVLNEVDRIDPGSVLKTT